MNSLMDPEQLLRTYFVLNLICFLFYLDIFFTVIVRRFPVLSNFSKLNQKSQMLNTFYADNQVLLYL